MADPTHCINCKSSLQGSFCHNCGQKSNVKRITLRFFIEDLTSKWIGWDNKFLRTIKDMTLSPGSVPRSYINGNRSKYVGPLGYAFLTTALMLLSYNLFNVDLYELIATYQNTIQPEGPQSTLIVDLNEQIGKIMAANYRFMVMSLIPFLALCSLMFYSDAKTRFNYLEHCVLFFYIAGHTIWLSILSIPLLKLAGFKYYFIIGILTFSFSVFGVYSFHNNKGFKGVLKSIMTYAVALILFSFCIGILMVFYMVFFTDFIDSIKNGITNN